jgi:hypothetical protein
MSPLSSLRPELCPDRARADAFAQFRRTRRRGALVVLAVMLPAIGVFRWLNR